jgi:hypothetical protein
VGQSTRSYQFSSLSPWVSNPAVPLPNTWQSPIHETVWHAVWGDRQPTLSPSDSEDTSRQEAFPTFTMWLTTLLQRSTPKTTSQESGRPASSLPLSGTRSTNINDRKGPKLVIAGMMKVGDRPCNIAQMSLTSGNWSLQELTQLSLYNSYSGGEVYYILANHTLPSNNTHGSRILHSWETKDESSTSSKYHVSPFKHRKANVPL